MALHSIFIGLLQVIRPELMSCEMDAVSPPSGPDVGGPRSIQSDHSQVHCFVVVVGVVVVVAVVVVVGVG